ncbi:hypothetical protein J6590_077795 [Homalodisca vitripennis]|nr:hypothetical protein J6590_077795 [Homalodisca vitripennis]
MLFSLGYKWVPETQALKREGRRKWGWKCSRGRKRFVALIKQVKIYLDLEHLHEKFKCHTRVFGVPPCRLLCVVFTSAYTAALSLSGLLSLPTQRNPHSIPRLLGGGIPSNGCAPTGA